MLSTVTTFFKDNYVAGCTDPWDPKVLRAAAGGHFHIPIKMDMIWSQHKEFLNPSDVVCLADSNTARETPIAARIPQHSYFDVKVKTSQSIAIVVGGETEGLSIDAFKLASKYNGLRLHIPLSNSIESLNSGCALSVVLFEIKRQLLTLERANTLKDNATPEEELKTAEYRI